MVEFVKDVDSDLVLSPYLQYPDIVREDGVTCREGGPRGTWVLEDMQLVCYLGDGEGQREYLQWV